MTAAGRAAYIAPDFWLAARRELRGGLFCSALVYFFFSKPHRGVTGGIATLGIWSLMISFGASYGNTVMTRISFFLQRADFLMNDHLAATVALVLVVLLFIHRPRVGPESGEEGP
ncbi:MAG: hypothetical protein ACE5G2_03180 [Candidatus Krumholzibacteriia bacterium]